MTGALTPDRVLQTALTRDPGRPLLVWYGPDAARVELSTKTYANSVAKAANLLAGEVEPGDPVAIDLPLHWQAAVWLGAAAAGGWPIVLGLGRPAALTLTPDPSRVTGRAAKVPLDPWGMGVGHEDAAATGPAIDVARELPGMPDAFFAAPPVAADAEAMLVGDHVLTGSDLVDEAAALAARLRLSPGDRFTTRLPPENLTGALGIWLLPLMTGATCILVAAPDADVSAERAVTELTAEVAR